MIMFLEFFYLLRQNKIPVSLHEWILLMRALQEGLIDVNLSHFYFLSRAILVKNESHYDAFDQTFLHYFKNASFPADINDQILDWLNRTPLQKYFSEEELKKLKSLAPDELRDLFQKRLQEQKEEHHGGNRWIGTGGTSPFGHGGYHPSGIRIGGPGQNRSAAKIAEERRFKNYRKDITLDIRQIQMALKKLRYLKRVGAIEELDMEETIRKTCQNAGDIDLVFKAPRKNQTKLLLLMDVGGTMDPYAHLVSQLFSAAHASNHFKDFRYYYFHNCVYSHVFSDVERRERVATADLFRLYDKDYKLIFVGDAWMHPYELLYSDGAIDFWSQEKTPGIVWLKKIKEHFTSSVWLNPERQQYWGAETIAAIRSLYSMHSLTLEGLENAVEELKGA